MARENELKAWFAQRRASAVAGRNTRVFAVRTIERKWGELGIPSRDLDAARKADRFESLSERLRPANIVAAAGPAAELQWIVAKNPCAASARAPCRLLGFAKCSIRELTARIPDDPLGDRFQIP